jgi:hypothetical protein
MACVYKLPEDHTVHVQGLHSAPAHSCQPPGCSRAASADRGCCTLQVPSPACLAHRAAENSPTTPPPGKQKGTYLLTVKIQLANAELLNAELWNAELLNAELPNVELPNAENYPTSNITERRILQNG